MIPKPRNIAKLQRLRERGASPPHEIVVSLVGMTPISDALHLYADPGCAYDWSDTRGLHTIIATRPGVDARHAIAGIFKAGFWVGIVVAAIVVVGIFALLKR